LKVDCFTGCERKAGKGDVRQALNERIHETINLLTAELGALIDEWKAELVEGFEKAEDRAAGDSEALHKHLDRRARGLGEECYGVEHLDEIRVWVCHDELQIDKAPGFTKAIMNQGSQPGRNTKSITIGVSVRGVNRSECQSDRFTAQWGEASELVYKADSWVEQVLSLMAPLGLP